MSELRIRVKGTPGKHFEVVIRRSPFGLRMTCTCPEGKTGKFCKHKLRLLKLDRYSLYHHDDISLLERLQGWIHRDPRNNPPPANPTDPDIHQAC